MNHPLDRPIWTALTTRQSALGTGGDRARRFDPAMVPFAGMIDEGDASQQALAELVHVGETVLVVQAVEPPVPRGFVMKDKAAVVQMVAMGRREAIADARVARLGEADAAEMLELATLTRPGPFTLRAQDLGGFWGVKVGGQLAAMAGLRLRVPGFYELSGVCTHPNHRGEGLGRLMSLFVAGHIAAGGDLPFLHAYATNTAAIRLYESIGFTLRSQMHVVVLERTG